MLHPAAVRYRDNVCAREKLLLLDMRNEHEVSIAHQKAEKAPESHLIVICDYSAVDRLIESQRGV